VRPRVDGIRLSSASSASPPKKSTLQRNIKRVKAITWEKINQRLVAYAQDKKIETGRKTRTDCTVVETHIHEPSDSSLTGEQHTE
jgi:IS5 family transposase